MSAPRYAVETLRGTVALISLSTDPRPSLKAALEKHGLELATYEVTTLNPSALPPADSYLLDLTPELGAFFVGEGRGVYRALTTYPHPHIYCLERAWAQVPLELPTHSTRLLLGEYLGWDDQGAPTLQTIQHALTTTHTLSLAGGGLLPFSLMSETYLVTALALLFAAAAKPPELSLSSPHAISLLHLVTELSVALKTPLTLSYTDTGLAPATPAHFSSLTSPHFRSLTPDNPLTLALAHLSPRSSGVPTPPPDMPLPTVPPDPTPVSPPRPRLPRLHKKVVPAEPLPPALAKLPRPRNLSELEFVPLSKPARPKLRLTLPKILRRRGLRSAALGLFLGIFVYLLSLVFALGISAVTLRSLAATLSSSRLPLAASPLALSTGRYLYTNFVAWGLTEAVPLSDAYLQTLALTHTLASLTNSTQALSAHVLGTQSLDLPPTLSAARRDIETLYQQLSLLSATLPATPPQPLKRYHDTYQSLKDALPPLIETTLQAKGVASLLPELIAVGGRVKYLVLFQNNMELRPTGGFIGSYGLLSFEDGVLYDFSIFDVYTADGALKGHVEPPTPIKDILGEANWYLRDSNFDPDFPVSARRAEWFLKKSMNQEVAGTIALNVETLRKLLSVLGPLELPDYNETVSSANLAERAQFHAEVNFFPGSTAKKEFLSSVADSLFITLKNSPQDRLLPLAASLLSSLESNDLQLSLNDPSPERILSTLGWNGRLEHQPCPRTPCYDDYLYTVDSNFGVNKANYYVTRQQVLDITFSKDGLPEHKLRTTYQNLATDAAWPAGTYKNYTRTYLPPGITVTNLSIDGTALSPESYTLSSEHGRSVVAFLLSVPINTSRTVELSYTSTAPLKNDTLYSLYLQRQSGLRATDNISVNLTLPQYLKPLAFAPEPTSTTAQGVSFKFAYDADHRLTVQF